MYSIGDKIVYPMHGAGVIESIEEKTVLGEIRMYYILRMPVGDMKVMIPTHSSDEIGVRVIIEECECDKVFSILSSDCRDMNTNWSKRYRENMLKIKSGSIFEVADVVKTLMMRDKERGLSTGERKMLMSARQILISELVLVKNIDPSEMEIIIRSYLQF
jgi:CarD family transcriptional regulator